MAVNIGPKIGIDGEKEYRKSINDIIQQQKTLKSEMAAISSSYDKNTSAMKKAKDQHEQLSKQVELQEKRVAELNKMLDESTRKYGENDSRTLKWKEAVNGATAELNSMKAELNALPSPIQAFGAAMQEAGEKLQGIGKGVTEFGAGVTAKITAPLAAVGGASIAAFKEVDAGMDTIIAKTGATGEALDGMQTVFENIATTIPTDFSTVGEAVGEVSTRFGVTGQELEDLTTYFIKFSDITGTDVTNAVDQTQKALSAFGLDASDATGLLDTLNSVGQNTGASMDSLLNGLIQNGTAFQEMGLSAEQAAVFMGQMETSGANSETVMQGLRKALKNATEDGIPLNQALSDLQNTILNGTDSMDGLTAAYDMFGKSGDQIYAAVQNGTLSFTDLAAAATDSSGSVAAAYEGMLDPADEATMAMNQAKLAGAEIGNTLMTIAAPAIQKVSEVVKDLKDKWDGLSPSQQENIVKFGLVAAAIGPVIVIGGTLISTIGSIIGVAGTLVSGIGAVVGVLGGPLTLAIGAAIAAGVLLYQNWDTVKQKVTDLATGVKQKWEDIKTAVKSGVDKLKNLMNFKWELPKLKLPHFSISGEFSLNPPSIPHINVEWYAKAMQNGVILRNPTIFGAAGGNLLGAGEAGPEVVVGTSSLFDMIRTAVGSTTNNYGGNNVYVYGAPGQDVHELAMEIADIIHADVQTKGAVWA